jgi:hypothetical protein
MNPYTAVAVTVAAGCLVVFHALRCHGIRGATLLGYTLGLGPLLGQGLVSLPMFYWRLAGWHRPGLIDFVVVTTLAFLIGGWASRVETPRVAGLRTVPARRPDWLDATCGTAALVALFALWNGYKAVTAQWPNGSWDAVAIWNVRAKTFFYGYDTFPTLLRETVAGGMSEYPLLLPGAVAALYGWVGTDAREVPQSLGLVNIVGLGILLFTVVSDWADRSFGAAAAMMLWAPQPVWSTAFGQVADVLVAYGILATFSSLASRVPGSTLTRLPAVLGGSFVGLLCWTKFEGLAFAGIITGWFLITAWNRGSFHRSRAELAMLVLAALPGFLAVRLFNAFWIPTTAGGMYLQGDWVARLLSKGRWWLTTQTILERVFPFEARHWWSYVWTVLAVGFVVAVTDPAWWRSRLNAFWALTFGTIVGFWLITYAATPFPLRWQLQTSLDRLMVQAYPLAIAGVVGAVAVQFRRGYATGPSLAMRAKE